jgi:predicted DNA-binding transcriptional regulator YafY
MQTEIFQRLERINYLIRIKGTGTPSELAQRMGLSERSIYQYLNLMKELGAPIKFSMYRQSYYYEEEGSFLICFFPKNKETPENEQPIEERNKELH